MEAELSGAPAHAIDVVPATAARLGDAADVLLLACLDDPMAATLVPPGAVKRQERLHLMYLAELHVAGLDRVDLAVDPVTEQVVGVAVWNGPPRPRGEGPAAADVARWAVSSVAALGHTGMITGRRHEKAIRNVRPPEPHWYLLDLAVDPLAQRRGIGAALLRHRLRQVDAEARRAFLCATTASSQELYERHGFVAQVRLPPAAGGATAMVRRPVITV